LPAFAIITGLCAIFWVGAAFLLARYVGLRKLVTSPAVLLAAAAAIVIWLARPRLRRLLASMRLTLRKYSRWEFWPAWLFYAPVVLMCARLALKYRGFTLPAIANPSQRNGVIIGESKFEILHELQR